jgi:hypothetical protein
VVGVSVILGIAAAIAAFVPHVSLELSQPSDPSDVFSAVAGLRNISVFTLADFHPYVGLCEILGKRAAQAPPAVSACEGRQGTKMMSTKWPPKPLRTDEAYDVLLDGLFVDRNSVGYAEISVGAKYHLWFWPWTRSVEFKLMTQPSGDGRLQWLQEPLD